MKHTLLAILLTATVAIPVGARQTPDTPATPIDHWIIDQQGNRLPTDITTGLDFITLSGADINAAQSTHHDGTTGNVDLNTLATWTIKSNVPSVFITLKPTAPAEGESLTQATLDQFIEMQTTHREHYYGESGTSAMKEHWFDATFTFKGYGHYPDIEETDCKWRGRGNSTWQNYEKKPFRVKFGSKFAFEPTDKNDPVFTKVRKSKNHVFLANFIDKTLMRNAAAMKIAELAGVKYVNHMVPVNVYYRTEGSDDWYYNGAFTLTEKYGINSASVDIDETTGALIELDGSYGYDAEKYYWEDGILYKHNIMIKDPDFDELYEADPSITPEQRLQMWKEDYTAYQTALRDHYTEDGVMPDVLDIRSAVRYVMVFNLCLNQELNYPKSVFLYKRAIGDVTLPADATEEQAAEFRKTYADELKVDDNTYRCLYHFGPVWDFDATFNYEWDEGTERSAEQPLILSSGNPSDNVHFARIIKIPEFETIWQEEWSKLKAQLPALYEYLEAYTDATLTMAEQNHAAWDNKAETFQQSTNLAASSKELIDWIKARAKFIDESPTHGLIK